MWKDYNIIITSSVSAYFVRYTANTTMSERYEVCNIHIIINEILSKNNKILLYIFNLKFLY